MPTLAIIPARSGSKGIPHKNILPFRGKPLLVHAIDQARASKRIDRVIVSTDSEAYAEIARANGAEVPFLRPPEISGDLATDLDVFQHALRWLQTNEGAVPELCVHLRPTAPIRHPEEIDAAIAILEATPDCDAVRSVALAPHTPYKMWRMDAGGWLTPAFEPPVPEAWNRPRQELPTVYLQNACIDIVRSSTILQKNSMTGTRIKAFVMDRFVDIDTAAEWAAAEAGAAVDLHGRKMVVDIDGVIASIAPALDYARAEPLVQNIETLRRLKAMGCRIVLFTARGFETGRDWREVTEGQMRAWGVPFDELRFGKPSADFYIDDKAIRISEIQQMLAAGPTGAGETP